MPSSLSLRVFYGAGAATESATQTAVHLSNADGLTSGGIDPGSYSYERWLALRVDTAPAVSVTTFWLQGEGTLPADVILRFGIADVPQTPVVTQSTIATMEFTPGRHFIFDTNTYTEAGEHTRYIVLQAQALSTADTAALHLTPSFGWSET